MLLTMQESGYMKMDHKKKCEELRKVRVNLADKLGLQDKIKSTPCEFKGECKGTCPACEAEEKLLNKALLARIAVIAGTALALAGCGAEPLEGDVDIAGGMELANTSMNIADVKEKLDKSRRDNEPYALYGEVVELDGMEVLPEDESLDDDELDRLKLEGDVEIIDD